jgi:hypothetical protein
MLEIAERFILMHLHVGIYVNGMSLKMEDYPKIIPKSEDNRYR